MKEKVVLLIEDNPDDVELTIKAFQKNGITNKIVVAHDGVEAIDMLFGPNAIKPVVVMLDIKLPKVDGFEVLKRIKSDNGTKLIPIVILTSSKEEQDLFNSYALGANSYVRKPVDFDQFIDVVKHLGLYWLLVNEPPPL